MDVNENISLIAEPLPEPPSPSSSSFPVPTSSPEVPLNEMRLVDIQVSNENVALNLMVSFLSLAQKRGTFTLDESAKIWECVQKFQMPPPASK
jgi:hypothetical protein